MLSHESLVVVAADLRRRAGLRTPAFSTTKIIETCLPGTLVTGGHLPDGVDEMVSRRQDGAVIVYARALPGPSQRFAIAHGIAHLLFDDASSRARPGRLGVDAVERRADRFATELLVPLDALRDLVARRPSEDCEEHEIYLDHVDELASRFAVPSSVIDERIRELCGSHFSHSL